MRNTIGTELTHTPDRISHAQVLHLVPPELNVVLPAPETAPHGEVHYTEFEWTTRRLGKKRAEGQRMVAGAGLLATMEGGLP